jgi:hypothetical protein
MLVAPKGLGARFAPVGCQPCWGAIKTPFATGLDGHSRFCVCARVARPPPAPFALTPSEAIVAMARPRTFSLTMPKVFTGASDQPDLRRSS